MLLSVRDAITAGDAFFHWLDDKRMLGEEIWRTVARNVTMSGIRSANELAKELQGSLNDTALGTMVLWVVDSVDSITNSTSLYAEAQDVSTEQDIADSGNVVGPSGIAGNPTPGAYDDATTAFSAGIGSALWAAFEEHRAQVLDAMRAISHGDWGRARELFSLRVANQSIAEAIFAVDDQIMHVLQRAGLMVFHGTSMSFIVFTTLVDFGVRVVFFFAVLFFLLSSRETVLHSVLSWVTKGETSTFERELHATIEGILFLPVKASIAHATSSLCIFYAFNALFNTRLPFMFFASSLTLVVSLFPFTYAWLVCVPWVGSLATTHAAPWTALAFFMAHYFTFSRIDSRLFLNLERTQRRAFETLKPRGSSVDVRRMRVWLTSLSVFFGVSAFGVQGVVLGPLLVSVFASISTVMSEKVMSATAAEEAPPQSRPSLSRHNSGVLSVGSAAPVRGSGPAILQRAEPVRFVIRGPSDEDTCRGQDAHAMRRTGSSNALDVVMSMLPKMPPAGSGTPGSGSAATRQARRTAAASAVLENAVREGRLSHTELDAVQHALRKTSIGSAS